MLSRWVHQKLLSRAAYLVWLQKLNCSSSSSATLVPQARERLKGLGEGQVSLVKDEGTGVATITLSHPQRKNALSGQMMVALWDITQELENWSHGKAVILCSEGDTFCSGGDLTTVRSISNPQDGLLMSTFMHDALMRLYCLPLVTVCLVHGKAIGGGAELTTATDYRIFTDAGEISFVQAKMGVALGWGGGTRLVNILGPSAALELFLTCKKVDGRQAMKLGLASHMVESKRRQEDTLAWLTHFTQHEPQVIQAMKNIVVGARDLPLHDAALKERLNFAPLWGGPANVRALERNIKHK
ncbi:hypothetical protein Pcinc_023350 [Petrolisthes cinctipes]|uniref:Ethylmalonyl-CoA decarboxylase n=1 Tax=Petrolisthes cinctipes TaxID=88211 RepID=A0AAE1KFW1_PETCI|nr:hypothetical protein Pcinc_023350 [Petrolisthes cinctipes]